MRFSRSSSFSREVPRVCTVTSWDTFSERDIEEIISAISLPFLQPWVEDTIPAHMQRKRMVRLEMVIQVMMRTNSAQK